MSPRFLLISILLFVAGGVVLLNTLPTDVGDPAIEPGSVEIVAVNVPLGSGQDGAVRIGFNAADPSARVLVTLAAGAGRGAVTVCPLTAIGAPLPDASRCTLAGGGVREAITGSGALGGVAVLLRGAVATTVDVRVEYAEGEPGIAVRIPGLEARESLAGCEDNACNPFVEVLPVKNGVLTATATFEGGPMVLEVLQGSVRARSLSATGVPYRIAASETGSGSLSVTATLTAPGEYALAFRHASAGAGARNIELVATWP